tara:strand:+ start:455 stop:1639 length:1185 start_codon:yes stop_codon:yes gene_type:complete
MTLDELLLEWSYRSERGYPSLDNPSDVQVLKDILIELKLPTDTILDNLSKLHLEDESEKTYANKDGKPGSAGLEPSPLDDEEEEETPEKTVDTDGDTIPDSVDGDSQYDAVIRAHLGLSNDQPIPKPKHKYSFDPGGGSFSIQVKGEDLKYWDDFWNLTPPKVGAEIGTTSKGSGDGEISLYWLYQHSDSGTSVRGTQGADNPDLEFNGLGVEVKAFKGHVGKQGLGRFGQDREQLKMLGVIFGINALASRFKGLPEGGKRGEKDVNPLTWDGKNLEDAMEEVIKFQKIDLEQLASIPGYDIFKEIKENMDFLNERLGNYTSAEEGARSMALEFIKPKIARKPGDGGFLVNVLRTGDCRFWKIEYDKVVNNENALKHIGASQAMMKVNFEELFG